MEKRRQKRRRSSPKKLRVRKVRRDVRQALRTNPAPEDATTG